MQQTPGLVAIALGMALLAALSMARPVLGLGIIAVAIGGAVVLASPAARLLVLVFGGLVVLGSSTEVSTAKLIYGAAVLGVAMISIINLLRDPPPWLARTWLWLGLALALAGSMVISTVATPGSDPTSIIRQGLFYMLIPLAPFIGVETGRELRLATTLWIAGGAGTLTAVGFAVDWLSRRGVAAFNLNFLVLGSTVLAGLGFALTLLIAVSTKGRQRVLWATMAAIIPVAMLVTGTRTNLMLFVVIVGMLGPLAKYRLHPGRAFAAVILVGAAIIIMLPIAARMLLSDPTFLDKRVFALLEVLSGSAAGDQSFQWRAIQYQYALDQIELRPLLGHGLGWNPPFAMDTPLVTVIKLGIVGTVVLVLFLVTSLLVIEKLAQARGYAPIHAAARGMAVLLVALLPFGSPIEDRGFSFTLALLFAGVAAAANVPAAERDSHRYLRLPQQRRTSGPQRDTPPAQPSETQPSDSTDQPRGVTPARRMTSPRRMHHRATMRRASDTPR